MKLLPSYIDLSRVFSGTNFLATIIPSDNLDPKEQIKKGLYAVDLGICNSIIKEHYNISPEENLIIMNAELNGDDDLDNVDNIDD